MPCDKSRQWAIVFGEELREEVTKFAQECKSSNDVDYFRVQEEQSEGGYLHFQAILLTRRQNTKNQVCKLFTDNPAKLLSISCEKVRDTAALARYCMKQESKVQNGFEFEFGAIPSEGEKRLAGKLRKRGMEGTTADILSKSNAANLAVAKRMCAGVSFIDALEGEDPNALFRAATIKSAARELQAGARQRKINEWLSKQVLKPWQTELLAIMDEHRNNRTVNVIVDYEGNEGKSYLLRYMLAKYGTAVLSIGGCKMNDALYAASKCPIEGPRYIVMDLSRTLHKQEGEEHSKSLINYDLLERLANGVFTSGKYDSTDVMWTEDRAITIFSNQHLQYSGTMSMDRWNVYELSNGILSSVKLNGEGGCSPLYRK